MVIVDAWKGQNTLWLSVFLYLSSSISILNAASSKSSFCGEMVGLAGKITVQEHGSVWTHWYLQLTFTFHGSSPTTWSLCPTENQ
jgi:hypothetical protein